MPLKKSSPRLGFIGLGSIGLPIASNLAKAGFNLKVHTRSRSRENDYRLKDAISCSSPKEVAKASDYLFICVSDDNAVEQVIYGQRGVIESLKCKSTIIDLSTISPHKARSLADRLKAKNVDYIDAPVTGGTEGAFKGNLTIFFGGSEEKLKEVSNLLKPISTSIYALGRIGRGQEVKAINQILVAGSYAALAEAIALGQALELPMDLITKALTKGAGNSWALENRSNSMIHDKYPLGFKLSLHHKDLCIALKTAKESGIKLPITTMIKNIEEDLISKGYSNEDVSALRRSIT